MSVYYVYILQSSKDRHYIGYTSNLPQRISQHNRKHNGFTGIENEVWEILLTMGFPDKHAAMKMEQKLKSFKNSQKAIEFLKRILVQSTPTKSGGS